jgi:hypothetical protein
VTTSVYPLIPDFEAFLAETAPSILRRSPTWEVVAPLFRPFETLDAQQADIIRAMDPEVAVGFWLDLCGSRVGEPRGGLSDAEYLRIILGRQGAAFALGTVPGVWACWLALTGATEDRARMYRVPAFGLPTVYLEAEVTTAPSVTMLRRMADVIKSAVVCEYDVFANVYLAGAARPGRTPAGGSATGAWTLPTLEAP